MMKLFVNMISNFNYIWSLKCRMYYLALLLSLCKIAHLISQMQLVLKAR